MVAPPTTPRSRPGGPLDDPLARRVCPGADAAGVAEAFVATLGQVEAALAPVIGVRGVQALYLRGLHLVRASHPWLPAAHGRTTTSLDLAALRASLAARTRSEALDCGNAYLCRIHELLTSLIGESLGDRLLHSVWANTAGTAPRQDAST